jgi:hypothetical protein
MNVIKVVLRVFQTGAEIAWAQRVLSNAHERGDDDLLDMFLFARGLNRKKRILFMMENRQRRQTGDSWNQGAFQYLMMNELVNSDEKEYP